MASTEHRAADSARPLIVGAGPVGLAAALLLAQRGREVRIIEQREDPSAQSRALAVNPRTLDILGPTGVTDRMLESGRPIREAHFHRRAGDVVLPLHPVHPRFPFMLALSQATTERLLEEALNREGVTVERCSRLVACRERDQMVEAEIEHAGDARPERALCPWLLGADGAHSTVRSELGIEFPGSSYSSDWYLADAPLRTEYAMDAAHAFFRERGEFLFMIAVVGDRPASGPDDQLWRLISNRGDPLRRLVGAEQTGPPVWASSFRVAHRVASAFAIGRVFLAGDSAHIHSPIGARGMNLGIEDAAVFAALESTGRMDRYDALRRAVDDRVVRQVRRLSMTASGETPVFRLARRFLLPIAARLPFTRRRMLATLTGLDHPMPGVVTNLHAPAK